MSAQARAPRGRRALIAGTALIVAAVMPGFLTASVAPRIRGDFAFGNSTLGVAVALFYVVSSLSSTPAGRLVERVGATRGMRLTAVLTALSCLTVAAFAASAAGLVALLVLGGVGNALGGPAVSALLKREVAGHRQGLAFGAQQAGASLGALMAGLALPVVAIPLGWRWAYVAAAALALVAATAAPAVRAPAAAEERGTPPRGLGAVHGLALAAALASAAGVGFVSFLVTYSVHVGTTETVAGLILGGVSLAATLSRVGLGVAADRGSRDPLRPVAAMLAFGAVAYLLLSIREPGTVVVAALAAGALGWAWPGGLTLAVIQRTPDAPAWAVGVMMSGLFAGAVAGPLLVGLLAEHDAFTAAWALCAALALGASALVELVHRRSQAGEPARRKG